MLESLHVKNLAILEEAQIEFDRGLNILTGETGAGKSVLLGSVGLATGEKASRDLIREGADSCSAEMVFVLEREGLLEKTREEGFEPEEGRLIFSRRLTGTKSISKINGEIVPLSKLKELSAPLLDIHGQQDSRFLLSRKNHLHLLDAFGKERTKKAFSQYQEAYHDYKKLQKKLEEVSLDKEERARELSFLDFEINEIEDAALRPGEDEELEEQFRSMSHAQEIQEALSQALAAIGSEGAGTVLSDACREVSRVVRYDQSLSDIESQMEEMEDLLNGLEGDLAREAEKHSFSDQEFQEVSSRLDFINRLKTKYGHTVEEILSSLEEKKARRDELMHFDESRAQAEEEAGKAKERAESLADALSRIRREDAKVLSKKIAEALVELNFNQADFEVRIEEAESLSNTGRDQVSFWISTNPGEKKKPLEKIASGGELSRIMLALKTVSADKEDTQTLIFDEIDSGISGRTAQKVAEKLCSLARTHQVICITHLPQIAAMAEGHFLIEKTVSDGRTYSTIRRLDEKESIEELARMMGGTRITQTALDNAAEMKQMAEKYRKGLE